MATRLYYNARLSAQHGNSTGVQAPLPVRFSDIRTQALVPKASDYQLSIVRFTTTLEGLPQLIIEHPTQAGAQPSTTMYEFTLSSGGVSVAAPVLWSSPNPTLTQSTGDLYDPYWYEYSYSRFGTLVNAALSTAMAALIAAVPALEGVAAPFFSFDSASATWSLYSPMTALNPATFSLSANAHAANLFAGFPAVPLEDGVRYNCFLQPNEEPKSINGKYYVVRQQTPGTLCSWNPVRRFVFTSSSLPVFPEAVVPSTPYGGGSHSAPNAASPIITDLSPSLVRGDELSFGTLEYLPTAEYRRIAMISSAPIYEVSFQLFWEDVLGGLHQHVLREGGFVSLKLLFERVG